MVIKRPEKTQVKDQDQISGSPRNLLKIRLKLTARPTDTVTSGKKLKEVVCFCCFVHGCVHECVRVFVRVCVCVCLIPLEMLVGGPACKPLT